MGTHRLLSFAHVGNDATIDVACTFLNEDGDVVTEICRNTSATISESGNVFWFDCPSCDATDVEVDR